MFNHIMKILIISIMLFIPSLIRICKILYLFQSLLLLIEKLVICKSIWKSIICS